jgi:transposase InsO family protein
MARHIKDYLIEHGIKHEVMTPNMLQHNGVAERLNRTLLHKAQAMLTDTNLLKSYWLEALNYATFLHNLSPSCSISTTPSELYTGTKPDVL